MNSEVIVGVIVLQVFYQIELIMEIYMAHVFFGNFWTLNKFTVYLLLVFSVVLIRNILFSSWKLDLVMNRRTYDISASRLFRKSCSDEDYLLDIT